MDLFLLSFTAGILEMDPTLELAQQAHALIDQLVYGHDPVYGFGSMSCTIYDSAWVSMVSERPSNQHAWLFPECFRYVLSSQRDDGAWDSYVSQIDGILNTAASLLSLSKHVARPLLLTDISRVDLEGRILKATAALQAQLEVWDVEATEHVGFEVLVPAMLRFLEDQGLRFHFPAESMLKEINEKKMAGFHPTQLYKSERSTILHSLEALVGMVDFDQLRHHKTFGSMMASPSATSAYLMFSKTWDDEAEAYLRHVVTVKSDTSTCSGSGVPSAFPSTYFEFAWTLCSLLEAGFDVDELGADEVERIGQILADALVEGQGLIGFAPLVGSDADDTSKAILALSLLDRPVSPRQLLDAYETSSHFKTYSKERNPSFSTNCNVLLALLYTAQPSDYLSQIEKIATFLCNSCWVSDGPSKDKWNISTRYPSLLLVRALTRILKLWDDDRLPALTDELTKERVPIVLYQALIRTLQTQNPDGSWGDLKSGGSHHEETAYSILLLASVSSITFVESHEMRLMDAIENGRRVLRSENSRQEFLWIEKVSYRSDVLAKSYRLAALKTTVPLPHLGSKVESFFTIPMKKVDKFTRFFSQLPLFANFAGWRLQAALIEGYLFHPLIRRIRLDIFPRKNMEEDKYFEYIPSTWTSSNNLDKTFVSPNFLYDMMVISFLNYQADEYMEAVVSKAVRHDLNPIKSIIERLLEIPESYHTAVSVNGIHTPKSDEGPDDKPVLTNGNRVNGMNHRSETEDLDDIRRVLKLFVSHVLDHPAVTKASSYDQTQLRNELRTFLFAHITQAEDNARLAAQEKSQASNISFQTPRGSFFEWVRTTSADHTSCPYSFAFVKCLLSSGSADHADCFATVKEKHISQDVCRHLATRCRLLNDLGSLTRDREEQNLNSANFPEFGAATSNQGLKDRILWLADYERDCMNMALERLQRLSQGSERQRRIFQVIQMFCNITDLYGQIYIVKDIASRMRSS